MWGRTVGPVLSYSSPSVYRQWGVRGIGEGEKSGGEVGDSRFMDCDSRSFSMEG